MLHIPYDFGWLPNKISSIWGSFTADQWKNWTLCISLFALKGLIPEEHYNCWLLFVTACRCIVKPFVSQSEVLCADALFINFCNTFERLYGWIHVKPNMHMHCHLSECIESFGSLYGFWLFSFERYNGLMSSIHTNNHNIETQLMNEFDCTDQLVSMYRNGRLDKSVYQVIALLIYRIPHVC